MLSESQLDNLISQAKYTGRYELTKTLRDLRDKLQNQPHLFGAGIPDSMRVSTDFGRAKTARPGQNCLSCTHVADCRDPKKSSDYRCSKFEIMSYLSKADVEWLDTDKISDGDYEPTKTESHFMETVNEFLESESPVARDIRVDDREFKLAPNFFVFATDDYYLKSKPFAKQIETGLHLFGDWCPKCSNGKFARNIPVDATMEEIEDRIQLLEYGVCPKCGGNRRDFIEQEELLDYSELAGLAGQRGGKSVLVAMLCSYVLHRYLKLQDPSKYFGLLDRTTLHGTFVALTYNQAKDSLWDPFYELLDDAPWFKNYHEFLDDRQKKLGDELYRFKDTFAVYKHRNLSCGPHGPNKRTLRGRTGFFGADDEIGWFDNNNTGLVKTNAREIYKAMNRRFQTLRSAARKLRRAGVIDLPQPLFCNISSPSSKMDMIMELYKRSQESQRIYGFHYSTWEMNPEITKEDLAEDFSQDPEGAQRDFGAQPPMSAKSFVTEVDNFKAVINKSWVNAITIEPKLIETKSGRSMTSARVKFNWKDKSAPKLLTIDPGYNGNSFAMTLEHVDPNDGPIFDALAEIMPFPGAPISFTDLQENVLDPIIEEMNVVMVVSDRWQSIKLLQDLEDDHGITVDQYSVVYADFLRWREGLYAGTWHMPRPEIKRKYIVEKGSEKYPQAFEGHPIAHLIFQSLTVQDIEGKTVDKGDGTTDDIFRAMVLGYTYLTNPETAATFTGVVNSLNRSGGGIIAISGQGTPSSPFAAAAGQGAATGSRSSFAAAAGHGRR